MQNITNVDVELIRQPKGPNWPTVPPRLFGKSEKNQPNLWVQAIKLKQELTCHKDRDKQEKVGEHLEPDHPHRLEVKQ